MRFIPTKMHAMMDYLGGIALIVIPMFWLGDSDVPAAALWVPIVAGILAVGQSLFTDYELSIANVISVPAHLMMDALVGAVVAASPWLFGFADQVWAPHLIIGLAEIGAALTTQLHRREGLSPTRHTRATA